MPSAGTPHPHAKKYRTPHTWLASSKIIEVKWFEENFAETNTAAVVSVHTTTCFSIIELFEGKQNFLSGRQIWSTVTSSLLPSLDPC